MSYTPVVTDAVRLVRALFSPGAVYDEQKEKPTFWMPWLVVSVLFAILSYLLGPYTARVQRLAVEAAGRPVPPFLDMFPVIQAASAPIVVLVMTAISAVVLWVAMMVMGHETGYRTMLSVVIFAWPVAVIQQALSLVILSMRGLDAIQGPADMQVSLGLDLLLSADSTLSPVLRAVLAGIGPLQIWALAITAVGLMVLGKAPKARAWIAASVGFVVGLLVAAGFAGLTSRGAS